ncbi:MAG: serine/threonine protein kinase [Gemmatimonadota bacterium]|nr:serine/threonine protein kinase [Gemmatimonadota bacterium]
MAEPANSRPRYQGLAAARRWEHEPVRPRAEFSLAVGDRIGEFTIIGHLARGRVAELYQVWSNKHWCALTGKLIAPEHLNSGEASSLRREAQVLAKLQHPNIGRYFGSGEAEGRPYLLLEYFPGPSLFDVLEGLSRRRLHVPDAIRAIMHIGGAVHYLHRCGYLYRDLKPANILLREGIPVLVDFDIVRKILPARRPADRLGTAPYMAPEQARRELLTPATDVYGLGALLYELLTGHWPTEEPGGDDEDEWDDEWESAPAPAPISDGVERPLTAAELSRRYPQLTREPTPLRQHDAKVSAGVERVVMRCLSSNPEERFQTVSGLLAALAPLLKGQHRLWPAGAPIERRVDTRSR